MKKIGIFGGSFDPVHFGHICLAKDAARLESLDKVLFVPARIQPFKMGAKTADGKDRLAMLNLAVEGSDIFEVSSYELDSNGISYTYLTLRAMRKKYGSNTQLCFITGTDSFLTMEKWKNSEEILREYSIIVGSRPGYRNEELRICIDRIRENYDTKIIKMENEQHDISSTEVRRKVRDGISAEDMIPEKVEDYIRQKGLYVG